MARPDESSSVDGGKPAPRIEPRREGAALFNYRLLDKIGEGNYGTVWRADRDGFIVALKELNKPLDSKETQDELKSLETLKKLHHKFILHTENFWAEAGRLYIEMEYAEGGSLKDRLKAYKAMGKPGIPEDELLKFFTETAQAIDYLHRQTPVILHRDIKPGNILLVNGSAKIADFGLLRQVSGDKSATRTQGGTLLYLAPEAIASDVASIHTDLFSFAVTYAELRQGSLPFTGKSIGQIYDKIRWEPPELSDIFHPDEKKILLKALDKEPKNRHASCYDFVFQLNRVVPWTPALSVPVLPTQPAASSLEAKSTAGREQQMPGHQTVQGNPLPTQAEMELEMEAPAADLTVTPLAGTDSKLDGTVKEPTKVAALTDTNFALPPREPPVPMKASAPAKVLAPPSLAPEIKPRPRPSRRRRRAPVFGALLLLVLIAGIAAAGWFAVQVDFKVKVDNAKKKSFPEALELIDNAKPWLTSTAAELRPQVVSEWWDALEKPAKTDIDSLVKYVRELKDFGNRFSDYDISPRRSRAVEKLKKAVVEDILSLLERRKPDEAGALVTLYQAELQDERAGFLEKIKNQQIVMRTIDAAEKKILAKDYEGCKELFKDSEALFASVRDSNDKDDLIRRADHGIRTRKERDRELVQELAALAKAKKLPELRQKLDEVRNFRAGYPLKKTDWRPSDVELATTYDPELFGLAVRLAAAWEALEQDKPKEVRANLDSLKASLAKLQSKAPELIGYKAELVLLEILANAQEATPGRIDGAFAAILDQMNLQKPGAPLASKIWTVLARLEERKNFFTFKSVDELEAKFSTFAADPAIKSANAKLLAHFLERRIKLDKAAIWMPNEAERKRCLAWFDHLEPPLTPYVLAFKAECLIPSKDALPVLRKINVLGKAGWYGNYVQALIEERKAQTLKGDEAADQYEAAAEALKDAEPSLDATRRIKAASLLHDAIASVRGPKVGEWNQETARRAMPWLESYFRLLDLDKKTPSIDNLIDLAYVAVDARKIAHLKDVLKRLEEKDKYQPIEQLKGYLHLARAERRVFDTASEEIESLYAKALELKLPNGKDDPARRAVAKDAIEYIQELLQEASADYKEEKTFKKAAPKAKRCGDFLRNCVYKWQAFDLFADKNLETLTESHSNAANIQAGVALFSAAKDGETAYYKVLKALTEKQPRGDGFLVPVIVKLPKYAPLDENPSDLMKEVDDALATAKKLAASRPEECRPYWRKWLCEGEVLYANWLQFKQFSDINDKRLTWEKDSDKIIMQNLKIRGLFEDGRALQRSEKLKFYDDWELSWQIGYTYYVVAMRKDDKQSAGTALNEFQSALDGIKKAGKEQAEKVKKEKIEDWMKKLNTQFPADAKSSMIDLHFERYRRGPEIAAPRGRLHLAYQVAHEIGSRTTMCLALRPEGPQT